ncbi:hypothetical protein [Asticcacaulis sp. EMRT-3]|uniref:hypothetical protein n=1 Tax=Asticcacaulis sp. EMRT-3 TaxID=3040349 RepID=UPI0024AEDFCA|nr:hypothetical protein [Asticcacaulis sp. EMRT-3]MDI7774282.1 hypothetical protein [Asticcacaulis sp. EMRT-3]
MNLDRRTIVSALALLPFWPALSRAAPASKEVLAFYYGWYATKAFSGQSAHWPDAGPEDVILDTPQGGFYDSLDPAVIKRQVAQAKAAGMTGFIASWWGQDDRTDKQLPLLLDACAAQGLKVCAYVEPATSPDSVATDVLYLHSHYAHHPAWLKLAGKPVIMFFDRLMQNLGLDGWDKARKLIEAKAPGALAFIGTANTLDEIAQRGPHFDAVHIYSQQFDIAHPHFLRGLWRAHHYRQWVRAQKGLAVTTATVLPGFDDHLVPGRDGKRPIVRRDGGQTFRRLLADAIAAKPDWLLIVSFNEWHEGSEIEPSTQYGDRELKTAAAISF